MFGYIWDNCSFVLSSQLNLIPAHAIRCWLQSTKCPLGGAKNVINMCKDSTPFFFKGSWLKHTRSMTMFCLNQRQCLVIIIVAASALISRRVNTYNGRKLSFCSWAMTVSCRQPRASLSISIAHDPSVCWATWPDSPDRAPTVCLHMPELSLRDTALSEGIHCTHEKQPHPASAAENIRPPSCIQTKHERTNERPLPLK